MLGTVSRLIFSWIINYCEPRLAGWADVLTARGLRKFLNGALVVNFAFAGILGALGLAMIAIGPNTTVQTIGSYLAVGFAAWLVVATIVGRIWTSRHLDEIAAEIRMDLTEQLQSRSGRHIGAL